MGWVNLEKLVKLNQKKEVWFGLSNWVSMNFKIEKPIKNTPYVPI